MLNFHKNGDRISKHLKISRTENLEIFQKHFFTNICTPHHSKFSHFQATILKSTVLPTLTYFTFHSASVTTVSWSGSQLHPEPSPGTLLVR